MPTTARETGVLMRSGMIPITRPDHCAYAIQALRRFDMLGASIKIATQRDAGKPGTGRYPRPDW